jgi:hypothetical protein
MSRYGREHAQDTAAHLEVSFRPIAEASPSRLLFFGHTNYNQRKKITHEKKKKWIPGGL